MRGGCASAAERRIAGAAAPASKGSARSANRIPSQLQMTLGTNPSQRLSGACTGVVIPAPFSLTPIPALVTSDAETRKK